MCTNFHSLVSGFSWSKFLFDYFFPSILIAMFTANTVLRKSLFISGNR
jgi:hypothetical protein